MNPVLAPTIGSMTATAGTLLSGRYRLEEQIGRGGMSTVWRAFDTTLERAVAIKMMHRDVARDSDQLERFRREAKAVAKVSSPYVVGVIDAGEEDHTPFIILEFVDGETLKERIRRLRRLRRRRGRRLRDRDRARAPGRARPRDRPPRRQAAERPARRGRRGAVTDFGIARSLADEGLTADGRVLGTTDYVSPEQALGHDVDAAVRRLLARGRPLRDAHRGRAVPRREPGRRRDAPRARGAARRAGRAARGVQRARRRRRPARRRRTSTSATPTAADFIADLEDALAIETARSGHITGEATTVFQSLPEQKRRRVPGGVQHPAPLAPGHRARRGRRRRRVRAARRPRRARDRHARAPSRRRRCRRSRSARAAPRTTTRAATSRSTRRPRRSCSTATPRPSGTPRRYLNGNLAKDGVGLAIDAKPGVAARQLELRTAHARLERPGARGRHRDAPRLDRRPGVDAASARSPRRRA